VTRRDNLDPAGFLIVAMLLALAVIGLVLS
jgi:hypothetical protein